MLRCLPGADVLQACRCVVTHPTCVSGRQCMQGDSFIVAFPHPAAALRCCAELQSALLAAAWPPELLQHAETCYPVHASPRCADTHAITPTTTPARIDPTPCTLVCPCSLVLCFAPSSLPGKLIKNKQAAGNFFPLRLFAGLLASSRLSWPLASAPTARSWRLAIARCPPPPSRAPSTSPPARHTGPTPALA